MKILITGHQGFIGSALYSKLKKNEKYNLFGADKKDGIDLSVSDSVQKLPHADLIVHLAASCSSALSISNPRQDFIDNVIATFNICEFAKKKKTPIIFASSCKIHPARKGNRAPYGLSKYVGEEYIKEYAIDYGIDYIINRFGTIYGPGQTASAESGWLTWFIKAALEKKPITIFGDGKQSRDVLFIEDCIELLVDQIKHFERYKNKTYEVGGGGENEISLLETLAFLRKTDYSFSPERIGDVKRFVSDNKLVVSINGWKPKIGWKEGIRQTLQSFDK